MELKPALKEQYHAGLAMLAQCIEKCPDDLWVAPNHCVQDDDRFIVRSFWRIAFHTVYFTHLYLGQNEAAFVPPPMELAVRSRPDGEGLWAAPWDLEPYEIAEDAPANSQKEIQEYIAYVDGLIDSTVDGLDLETEESGFSWYRKVSKMSHQLLNLRHLQGHVGQLSELLMARGIDTDWMSQGRLDS